MMYYHTITYNIDYPSYPLFCKFFKWLDDGLVCYPKLELKFYSDDHRGVFAKNKIQKNEIVLKIPSSNLITLEMAKESPVGTKMLNANLDLLSPKHCYLSAFLLQEKDKIITSTSENSNTRENSNTPKSKWENYLNILPKNYNNFPIFYTPKEKQMLI